MLKLSLSTGSSRLLTLKAEFLPYATSELGKVSWDQYFFWMRCQIGQIVSRVILFILKTVNAKSKYHTEQSFKCLFSITQCYWVFAEF